MQQVLMKLIQPAGRAACHLLFLLSSKYSKPLKLARGRLCRWYCMYRHSAATITATSPSLLLAVLLLIKLNTILRSY
jgi:hypothetical protein